MSASLQVVALVSGGKDSLFSLLHCLQNGHRVVALANLYPPARPAGPNHDASSSANTQEEEEEEDMNSFMYQTVGHRVIPLYADALGLPLYRREISGSAIQTGRYYDTSSSSLQRHDEAEDLFELLQDVRKSHLNVNAVSSGAILSTYQRTRVESVAVRLGLKPLAYLWQYPALPPPSGRVDSLVGLLDDMAAAGCDARIIKIATGGMKETMLWSNVTNPRTRSRLVAGMAPFYAGHEFWLRGAVLGEGGEYETLAIDGPRPLWKKKLVFDDGEVATITGKGGVYHTRLGGARTVEKKPETGQHEALVRVPNLFDAQFQMVRTRVAACTDDGDSNITSTAIPLTATRFGPFMLPKSAVNISPAGITLSNVVADDAGLDAASQMSQIVRQAKIFLGSLEPPSNTSNAVSALLLLSSMSDFVTVNHVYASLFPLGEPNPPARVTVAVDFPAHVKVSLSLVVLRSPRSQIRGLHVQSRSYWAPANIGPYSQAISEPLFIDNEEINVHDGSDLELVHVAGQIPLVPQSMDMFAGTFEEQAVLSLQHLWRVGQERGVDLWPWGIAFLSSTDHAAVRAEAACKTWLHAHTVGASNTGSGHSSEEEEVDDAWYGQHNRFDGKGGPAKAITCGEHLHPLPTRIAIDGSASLRSQCPPCLAAEVVSLPRDAPVEWWTFGLANIVSSGSRASFKSRSWPWGSVSDLHVAARHAEDSRAPNRASFVSIFFDAGATPDSLPSLKWIINAEDLVDDLRTPHSTSVHATLFLSTQSSIQPAKVCSSLDIDICPTIVPCRRLWGSVPSLHSGELALRPFHAALFLRILKR